MNELNPSERFIGKLMRILLLTLGLALAGLILLLSQTALGGVWSRMFDATFGASTGHLTWFVTRASGVVAYLLLWLSTVWGLAVSSKMFDRAMPRAFTYDTHEYLSLLALGFTLAHVFILLGETYMPFNLVQLLVPFISDYRPFWIGIGIVGTYVCLLVTLTFYARKWIGQRAFRVIHYSSFIGFFAVLLHSWFAGTDTGLAVTRIMYMVSGLSVVFMTVYWLVLLRLNHTQTAVMENRVSVMPRGNTALE